MNSLIKHIATRGLDGTRDRGYSASTLASDSRRA
jgi:hypothetical protein